MGVTKITWDTGDGSEGQVYVSRDGGPETLFAASPHGSKDASWIQTGGSYEFCLYRTLDKCLLKRVGLVGLETPPEKDPLRDLRGQALTLGFPVCEPSRMRRELATEISTNSFSQLQPQEITFEDRKETVLVSVCTTNCLHFARTLIASVREHHPPHEIAIYLLVVDWDGLEPLEIPSSTLIPGRNIGIGQFDFMALKYTARELCCACKPYFIKYVMATTRYHKLLYLDSDICIFARLDYMLDCLNEAKIVVTPHTLEPIPNGHQFFERPTLAELISAGTYNAGMFGMTVVPDNVQFVTRWAALVTAPGAFVEGIFGKDEQQYFNWLAELADDVKINKDTAYNVAYWNLHDRSLRYSGWDSPALEPGWQVDGKPLVAFHFSGFSPDEPRRISTHDSRYSLYVLPSVSELIDFYLNKLFEHGASASPPREYYYDRFRSGLRILPEIRQIFKKYETRLWRDCSPWCESGERHYVQSLFLPVPETASLLPIALYEIYQLRPDLQFAFPQVHLQPESLLCWFSIYGKTEFPTLYEYFNYYRPAIPKIEALQSILDLKRSHSASFAGLDLPMSKDRSELITRLIDAGHETVVLSLVLAENEYFAPSPIYLLWRFVEQQGHLRDAFPDLLFDDAPAFSEWLRQYGSDFLLEPELADVFMQKAEGRSLARIFSFLNGAWEIASQWPLGLVGKDAEACAHSLLRMLQHDPEFDLDDLVMYLWIMSVKPWAGIPLTFELLVNACRQPSPLLPEGQETLLGELLAEPQFRNALSAYRRQTDAQQLGALAPRRFDPGVSVMEGWSDAGLGQESGVNFFGYFKSPIGLGSLSRGLSLACRSAGVLVQENIIGNLSMVTDLQPKDFIRTYDHSLNTNLFLSFPHLRYRLLQMYPEHVVKQRRNIIYLAWEQRDGYPSWAQDYAEFDQIWALSDFAAGSFRRYMKRDDVITVRGVIDFDALPAPANKEEVRLDPDRFTFLYIFDANSSIERKNPSAVISAFARAFSADEKVQLLLKVSNAYRLDHLEKLRQLTSLAAHSGLEIRFLLETLPYNQLLRLLSAADCYVSLHRAEGFGYTCAEAMAYAKPVIATNYSATTEFMDNESAYLVDYRECEVTVADGPFQRGSVWAEPSVEHAAAQMRRVYHDQLEAQRIGMAGQVKVRQLLSAERIGRIAAAALSGQTERHKFSELTALS